jgi:hypothetical protein
MNLLGIAKGYPVSVLNRPERCATREGSLFGTQSIDGDGGAGCYRVDREGQSGISGGGYRSVYLGQSLRAGSALDTNGLASSWAVSVESTEPIVTSTNVPRER